MIDTHKFLRKGWTSWTFPGRLLCLAVQAITQKWKKPWIGGHQDSGACQKRSRMSEVVGKGVLLFATTPHLATNSSVPEWPDGLMNASGEHRRASSSSGSTNPSKASEILTGGACWPKTADLERSYERGIRGGIVRDGGNGTWPGQTHSRRSSQSAIVSVACTYDPTRAADRAGMLIEVRKWPHFGECVCRGHVAGLLDG